MAWWARFQPPMPGAGAGLADMAGSFALAGRGTFCGAGNPGLRSWDSLQPELSYDGLSARASGFQARQVKGGKNYLRDVFQRLPAMKQSEPPILLPRCWKPA